MKRCIKIIVKGKVQGVSYRDFIQKNAERLGVEGSVQNKDDGTVIIHACGFADILDDFIDFIYQGSNKSLVQDVSVSPLNEEKNFRGVFRVIG